uniref:EGF-like domain-containing protein n=1 Tax=Esox lucius TaxID=8010 RepID=A0AAY5K9W9_ESOLU
TIFKYCHCFPKLLSKLLLYLSSCPTQPPTPPPQICCHGYQKVPHLSARKNKHNLKDTEKVSKTLTKVLKVMDSLSKVASCFGFVGSILGLILAFIPQSDPNMEFMKEQFSEINRKLDPIALQIDSLTKEIEWDTYASTYGRDENAIKNSWAELMKFLDQAPTADERRKSSLAEAFTIHYTNSATRNSVSNFYHYLTENEAASLNKNLLQLVIQKSKGDIKILSMYSDYFLSLMVKGLQLNVYYDIMMGYGGVSGAKEGVERLTTMLTAMKEAMIQCADETLNWALEDANKIATEQSSSHLELANAISTKLNQKFIWYEWTVIVHGTDDEEETLKHLEYIHTVKKVKMFDLTIFLKSNDVVEQDPCSEIKCHNDGKCKQLKDTTEELCICTRMFTGPTCEESVEHFIDFSAIEAQLSGIALNVNYKCTNQPCRALFLPRCDRCSIDRVCWDHKVCRKGKCISACKDNPCGINTVCTGANHVHVGVLG